MTDRRLARRLAAVALALLAALGMLIVLAVAPLGAQARRTVVVSPQGPHRSVAAGLAAARAGDRVLVKAGVYREPELRVTRPVELVGEGWPVLDGEHERQILVVGADDVTVRGLVFRNVGRAMSEDRAAVRITAARNCRVEGNRFENAFFGVYLAEVQGCRVARNVLRGVPGRVGTESDAGNGIHLWNARDVVVEGNTIRGHRDGIYLEFTHGARVAGNLSEGNLRYGLHFMYSDDCRYERNRFRRNLAGVAVMYTKRVEMIENAFEDNWGSASYGLLLKEIESPRVLRNTFARNTVGLLADGATHIVARGNVFEGNGWGVKLQSSTYDGRFEANDFTGNTFDVATNARESQNVFRGNWFDDYRGYDLDRDGTGDVPHRPVRLFSVVVERNPPTLILLRTVFVSLLETAERVVPALTPPALADAAPAMRPVARPRSTRASRVATAPAPRDDR